MSDYNAYQDDMGRLAELTDRDVDRLVAGESLSGVGAFDDLAAFIRDVRTHVAEPPAEATAALHLAAIVQAAESVPAGDEAATAARSGSTAAGLVRGARSRSGPNAVRRHSRGRRRVKLVAAVVVALSAFGGAAFAGALPGPVQGQVADLVDRIGIELPGDDAHDRGQGNVPNPDQGTVNEPARGAPSEHGTQRTRGTHETEDAEAQEETDDTQDTQDIEDTGGDEGAGDSPGDPDEGAESDRSESGEGSD